MPNFVDLRRVGREATKCLATCLVVRRRRASHVRAVPALVIVSWVVKVFDATMKRVVSGSRLLERLGDVRAVDVGDEVRRAGRARRRASAPRSTITGPEVGAADADVDDVGDRLAGVAGHAPLADRVGELAHVLEDARSPPA